jgi:hypothetical protein
MYRTQNLDCQMITVELVEEKTEYFSVRNDKRNSNNSDNNN